MSTALSWKDMMGKQRANAVANGNNAKVAKINALLATNGVVAAPAPAVPALVPRNINLSNFKPAQLAHLAAVSASMRPRKTELELSYNALKKAESTGKKRTRRTRKTRRTRRTRRGKRT